MDEHEAEIQSLRAGFTLVELLVVISIIAVLMALAFPALSMARSASRKAQCQSNLRQFGIAMLARADRFNGELCSGAFDWLRDGCVVEQGWVADVVSDGTPAGEMLCPSNPAQISETYNQLLAAPLATLRGPSCVDRRGKGAVRLPDGSTLTNPCRQIIDAGIPAGSVRIPIITRRVYEKHFNTNYAASWFLVRSGPQLDRSGNLKHFRPGCTLAPAIKSRNTTIGPLNIDRMAADVLTSFVPLLGCARDAGQLALGVGPVGPGELVAKSFTTGPVRIADLRTPSFPSRHPRTGPAGWWADWNKGVLQDYRGFAPIHSGNCNLLFADGSVRAIYDRNRDEFLNNGFPAAPATGFRTTDIEMSRDKVLARYSIAVSASP